MQMMTENRIRHLPVVDHGALVGIVTIGDAVKAVMAEQAATINHLASYISGDLAPDPGPVPKGFSAAGPGPVFQAS